MSFYPRHLIHGPLMRLDNYSCLSPYPNTNPKIKYFKPLLYTLNNTPIPDQKKNNTPLYIVLSLVFSSVTSPYTMVHDFNLLKHTIFNHRLVIKSFDSNHFD